MTDIKPRDLGILKKTSYAFEGARDDGFLTIRANEDISDEEGHVQHMLRDLMDMREGTL